MELDGRITQKLMDWYAGAARDLPWRHSRDPYGVWLSEIMLQQTRVDTVIPYYERFLREVPTLAALAALDEGALLKLWEGLGYYTRARNLQRAAQRIVVEYDGVFPRTVAEIRALPGIGEYTAGAIASICFDAPEPAVDGNVLRVVARLTRTAQADGPAVKKEIAEALRAVYPAANRGDFTQALMELGAMVCLPNGAPLCARCPLQELCAAHRSARELDYPEKKEKPARRAENLTVFILRHEGRVALRVRETPGVLHHLWELPNAAGHLDAREAAAQLEQWDVQPLRCEKPVLCKHIFTHIEWRMRCYDVACGAAPPEFAWATPEELSDTYALPTAFRKLLVFK